MTKKKKNLWNPETEELKEHIELMGDELIKVLENIEISKPNEYVWVTYDPLYEKIICVHRKLNSECDKCKSVRKKRDDSAYHLKTFKFKIRD